MILQIAEVLSRPQVEAVRDALGAARWEDGGATAGGRARSVKQNLQAAATPETKGALELIRKAVLENETVKSAARPAAIGRLILNRFDAGMEYGAHSDAPYIDGIRTDVSFTLFLSDPAEYAGGALMIDSVGAEDRVRLAGGSMALYPATSIHRVERVTRGTRLACAGWIRSLVKSSVHRALLFEADRLAADLAATGASGEIRDRLANLRNHLLRLFGE